MKLDGKDLKILKDIINAGCKMMLHKYSEEELNKVIDEIYKNIK